MSLIKYICLGKLYSLLKTHNQTSEYDRLMNKIYKKEKNMDAIFHNVFPGYLHCYKGWCTVTVACCISGDFLGRDHSNFLSKFHYLFFVMSQQLMTVWYWPWNCLYFYLLFHCLIYFFIALFTFSLLLKIKSTTWSIYNNAIYRYPPVFIII